MRCERGRFSSKEKLRKENRPRRVDSCWIEPTRRRVRLEVRVPALEVLPPGTRVPEMRF
jgi:hypothetical protein